MPGLLSISENVLSMTREEVFNEDGTKIKKTFILRGKMWNKGSVPWGRDSGSGPRNIVPEVVSPVSSLCHKGKWRVPKFRSFLIKDGTENLLKGKASNAWEIMSPDTHPSGEPITVVLARKTKPSLEMKLAY